MSEYKLVPAEQSACPMCHGEGLRLNPLTEVPVLCANCNGGRQPECGCCGQTDRCDDDCDAVVIGGHRAAGQQPAPDVVALVVLLEHAQCPNCDGSGARHDNYGEPEQCQWCHERAEALAAHRKQGGE